MTHPFSLAAPVGLISSHMRELGASLRSARTQLGLSVRQQASRAGLSPEIVERIERGVYTVSCGEVLALCLSLGVTLTGQSALSSARAGVVPGRTRPTGVDH
ncbi:MAG: helix-turn-helix domain-containing protein [Gammaproteobacteria bacterium]